MSKILIFGAGKIGRSFIAQLFGHAGYQIVFVDSNFKLVTLLNQKKNYNIVVKGENEKIIPVENIRALLLSEKDAIIKEVCSASVIVTSVGKEGLNSVFPILAEGLSARRKVRPTQLIDIIIAENIRNAAILFKKELKKYLKEDFLIDKYVGLVETSIGKMVPVMLEKDLREDPLLLFAEEFNTLLVDSNGFISSIPEIEGLCLKENFKAWVDRKFFIHNLGHASAAYFGFQVVPDEKMLWKVLQNPVVYQKTYNAMLQSAKIIQSKYPEEYSMNDLHNHILDLLDRFRNKCLKDTVYRVGCDLYRKLGKNDRLAGAIHLGAEQNLPFNFILDALTAGFQFRASDEKGNILDSDKNFYDEMNRIGIKNLFCKITGIKSSTINKFTCHNDFTLCDFKRKLE